MQERSYNRNIKFNINSELFSINGDVPNNQENNGLKSPPAPQNTPKDETFVTRLNDQRLREKLTKLTEMTKLSL